MGAAALLPAEPGAGLTSATQAPVATALVESVKALMERESVGSFTSTRSPVAASMV